MTRVPFIVGPTGIGKSRAAFEIAKHLGGEVVVADSRQVYKRLDIATNKPRPQEMAEVRYHMVGVVEPTENFNVHDWATGANAAISDIARRGRLPIVEGGSMLYVDVLADGFSLAGVAPRRERRRELEALATGELAAMLGRLDPTAQVDLKNRVRLVRAIEVLEVAGAPLGRLRARRPPGWEPIRIGLTADLGVVDSRLAERSRRQVERGLIEETREALESGVSPTSQALTGIGYREAVAHLRGEIPIADLAGAMARSNRRYARAQLRWLRRDGRIRWFDAAADPVPAILGFLRETL